jgi:hypothetical protein
MESPKDGVHVWASDFGEGGLTTVEEMAGF